MEIITDLLATVLLGKSFFNISALNRNVFQSDNNLVKPPDTLQVSGGIIYSIVFIAFFPPSENAIALSPSNTARQDINQCHCPSKSFPYQYQA